MYKYGINENVIILNNVPDQWEILENVIVINHSKLGLKPYDIIPKLQVWKRSLKQFGGFIGLHVTDIHGVEYSCLHENKFSNVDLENRIIT
jgi:hypothetical protein